MIPFLHPKTVVFTSSGALEVNACKHTTEHSSYNLYVQLLLCTVYAMYKLF